MSFKDDNELDDMQCDDNMNIDNYEFDKLEDIEDEENFEFVDDSIFSLVSHSKDVFCLIVSSSKRWLASGSEDDTACIWDLNNLECLEPYYKITDHSDSVCSVVFNSSNTLLATADLSGVIICTDIENKSQRCKINESGDLEWILWHNIANILFGGFASGDLWMWLITEKGVAQSKIYSSGTLSPCIFGRLFNDSNFMLAVYSDGNVRSWDLKNSTNISVRLPCSAISADLHPTNPLVTVGCSDGTTVLISTNSMKILKILGEKIEKSKTEEIFDNEESFDNSVESTSFAPNFPWVATATTSGILRIYDYDTGLIRYACDHDGNPVVKCLWRFDKKNETLQIISACMDGGVRIWDAKTGEPIKLSSCGGNNIFDFCVVEQNNVLRIFVACNGGVIKIFDC